MAVFKCEKFPSLLVVGAGKFADGSLEVEGEAAKKVRALVGNPAFGVAEESGGEDEKPASRRGRPRKTDD